MMLFLITTLIPVLTLVSATHNNPFRNGEALIEKINSNPNSTWRAGHYFNPKLSRSYLRSLLGTKERSHRHSLPLRKPILDIKDEDIPEKFDAREKWPKCKIIQHIRDQGNCGSCWAVAAASTFSDRRCIASDGKINEHLSAEELTACCKSCGNGCLGGWPEDAWKYFKTNGIVTGGDYDSSDGCQPYSKKPCEHHVKGSRPKCASLGPLKTPSCEKKCTNKSYKKPFAQDHRKVSKSYSVPADEKSIQKEIMKHGPVEAAFFVFEDFLLYKKGIYQHTAGSYLSGHAVKLIGWGVSKDVKYWLVQNQWNTDWGEKGLFRIRRGNDESGFESRITAGIPIV